MTPEPLDYATSPVGRPLGWRWVAPIVMNCISTALGTLLALAAWRGTSDYPFNPLAWIVMGGPIAMLQVSLLLLSLAITRDTHQPTWNPVVRRAVLWTAPVGLVLSLVALSVDAFL